MSHSVVAEIDLEALHYNLAKIKEIANSRKVLAMVKSNAYGHGLVEIASSLQAKVDAFGAMCVDEALKLRASGINKPIVILSGFIDQEELEVIDRYHLEVVVHNFNQLTILEKSNLQNPLKVWLKIDTGMHRLGFQPSEVQQAYQRLMSVEKVIKKLFFITHFSDADDIKNPKTAAQLAAFENITANLEGTRSLSNSAAILNWPGAHADWIRPGITLHGVSPLTGKTGLDLGFKPVMTFSSRLIAIHDLEAGDTVGYGSTWECKAPTRIGIVAAGYGDGYPRSCKNGTPILINGVRCPLIGRVAMDMTTVDLSALPNAKIGDQVILWGQGLPVEEIALAANTIPYELFCRMTTRVHYQYK